MTLTRKQAGTLGIALMATLLALGALMLNVARLTDTERAGLVQRGAYATWDVTDACLDSHETCAEALDRQNAELKPFGLEIMEDGSTVPIKLADQNRKIANGG